MSSTASTYSQQLYACPCCIAACMIRVDIADHHMTFFTQCSVGCTDSVVKCWKLLQCICISQVPACCVQCMQDKCLSCTGSIQLHVVWSCGHGQDVCWIRCGTDHGPHHGGTHGEQACPHCQPTRVVTPSQLLNLVHVSCAYRPACIDHNCSHQLTDNCIVAHHVAHQVCQRSWTATAKVTCL